MAKTTPVGYIAACIPAKPVYVSGTTLFHLAEDNSGDALHWVDFAVLNNMTDPWIRGLQRILVPPVFSTAPPTGILGL